MSSAAGPSIATSGLVLDFDAANLKSFGPFSVEALVVGGGGAAGSDVGAGGGGGAVLYSSSISITAGTAYTITVGAGGATGSASGSASVFSTLTAAGGVGGLNWSVSTGGASGNGNAGGASIGYVGLSYTAGGGGGAGGTGGSAYTVGGVGFGGNGGIGVYYPISGTIVGYGGGGGGGGGSDSANVGGAGTATEGGGAGSARWLAISGYSGTANTGGGGGGTGRFNGVGLGGSGVVIIRYPGLQKATGGTITSVGGYTVHTFTTVGSSTFTPGTNWADVSTGGNVGTLNNSPTYSSANGGALVFNGSNTWIESPTSAVFDTQTLTMESWCKPTVISQDGFLFEKGQVNTQYSNFFTTGNALIFRIIGLSTQDLTFSTSAYMTANTWNHIVCTYSAGVKTIYLNGAQIAQQTGLTGAIPTGQTNQYIGKYGAASNNYMFTGSIAVSKVYNRALSAAEVAQNFNATRSRYGL